MILNKITVTRGMLSYVTLLYSKLPATKFEQTKICSYVYYYLLGFYSVN